MQAAIKKGFGFGLVSGVITTLGLMTGLNSGTHLKTAILGGILVIAIADAMSDALGIHMSEEADKHKSQKDVWRATRSTFITKLIVALLFALPIIIFKLPTAILVNIGFGLLLIIIFSYYIAGQQKLPARKVIFEHLLITGLVIGVTHLVGLWVATFK